MTTLCYRLREERMRRGLNQTDFAALANGSRGAQAAYERDEKIPGGGYLMAIAATGVDILYVLTGRPLPDIGDISNDEIELVKLFRAAPLAVKAAALAALTAGSSASGTINISGQGNRVAGRDYNENKK